MPRGTCRRGDGGARCLIEVVIGVAMRGEYVGEAGLFINGGVFYGIYPIFYPTVVPNCGQAQLSLSPPRFALVG